MFLLYWCVQFYLFKVTVLEIPIARTAVELAVLFISVFVVESVVKRNKLTKNNSFAVVYYVLLFVVFPDTMGDSKAIFTSFFVLLAFRSILRMKALKNIKLKIFDAGLYICISSLFYEWAILYLLFVFAAIYFYDPKNIRNWLVIISVVFCFFMMLYSTLILVDSESFLTEHYNFTMDWGGMYAVRWGFSIKLSMYALLNLALVFWIFFRLNKGGMGKVVIMRLIALAFVLGVVVNVLVTEENTNAVIITFFPSVVFIVNYLESIKKPKILELILIASILVPIAVFIGKL